MTATDYTIDQNDTLDPLVVVLQDDRRLPVVLGIGDTVTFTLRGQGLSAPLIDAAPMDVIQNTDGSTSVRYDWQPADTIAPGLYFGWIHVTSSSGRQTYPKPGPLLIEVVAAS